MRQLTVLIRDLAKGFDDVLRLPLSCQCKAVEHLHQLDCVKVGVILFDAHALAVVFQREAERLVNLRRVGRRHVVLV